jgi:hypothetical protein
VFKVWKAERRFRTEKGAVVTVERTNEKLHVGNPTECLLAAGLEGTGVRWAQARDIERRRDKVTWKNTEICDWR